LTLPIPTPKNLINITFYLLIYFRDESRNNMQNHKFKNCLYVRVRITVHSKTVIHNTAQNIYSN